MLRSWLPRGWNEHSLGYDGDDDGDDGDYDDDDDDDCDYGGDYVDDGGDDDIDDEITCSNVEIMASDRMKWAFSRSNWALLPFLTLSPPSVENHEDDLMMMTMYLQSSHDDNDM